MQVPGVAAGCTMLLTSQLMLLSRDGAVSETLLTSFELLFKGPTSLHVEEMPAVELRGWLGLDPLDSPPPAPLGTCWLLPGAMGERGDPAGLQLALIPSEPASQSCMEA